MVEQSRLWVKLAENVSKLIFFKAKSIGLDSTHIQLCTCELPTYLEAALWLRSIVCILEENYVGIEETERECNNV